MPDTDREQLRAIKTFPSLVKYLRDELDWPIESEDFEDLTFDYEAEELGIDPKTAAKIQDIKQLRPLVTGQPWGVFFVKFEPNRLPIVALRRILSRLVIRKRSSAKKSEQASWALHDLLFISNYGEGDQRQMTFAHFAEEEGPSTLPTLRVLGWDDADTALHIDHVHEELKEKLRWPHDKTDLTHWRDKWSSAFALRHREVISTSKDLAIRLADLARRIRRRANHVLAIETERGPLRKLHKAFQEALIHDLTEDDFADMYAQTITYGLFSAAVSRTAPGLGTAVTPDNLADMVPITNPFLKEMLATFLTVGGRKAKMDFDELGIQEVVNLLNSPDTHMDAILRDFGKLTQQEDPVIHFYELFLAQYDKKKKVRRGVFYTPPPVVCYIVRSVDELLRTEFGLADGLADTATWGEMKKRFDCNPGLQPAVAQEQAGMPAPQELMESSDPHLTAGSCILRRPDIAGIVQDALLHFEGQRYHLCAWCIMPNHVHVVVQPLAGHELQDILHSWKSFTATKINRLLHRQGALWERESFNHLIRRAEHVERFVYYTEDNPVAAGFTAAPKDWPFSSCGAGLSTCGAGLSTCGAGLSTCGAGFQPAPLEFVDPRKTPFVEPRSRGELPHLQKEGGTYFITWCLLDATCDAGFQPAGSELSQPCGAGFQPAAAEVPSAAAGEKGIGAGKMPAPQFHIPDGVKPTDPFVTILDPACGTGTFLVEVIDVIHRTMTDKWKVQGHGDKKIQALWNEYVPRHLLPRLYGYELMMAPYAIAHMKVPLKLKETGFTAWDKLGDDTRVRIYLTNSLEPPSDIADAKVADLFGPLAREAQEVNDIKRHKRFTVVIGNPPYAQYSMNLTEAAKTHIEKFRYANGQKIRARNPLQLERNLNDDYVKFLGFSAELFSPGTGVLGMITNRMFLDSESLVGLREWFSTSFDKCVVIDLRGSTEESRRVARLANDQNVFDILQGVAISFYARRRGQRQAANPVRWREVVETRELKYALLLSDLDFSDQRWDSTQPQPPMWWLHRSTTQQREHEFTLAEVFPQFSTLIASNRDHLVVGFDPETVLDNVRAVRHFRGSNAELWEQFSITLKSGWNVTAAREKLQALRNLDSFIQVVEYRPFDRRRIFFHPTLVWQTAPVCSSNVLDGKFNRILISLGKNRAETINGQWVASTLADKSVVSTRDNASGFPLYLYDQEGEINLSSKGEQARRPNLSPEFLKSAGKKLGLQQMPPHGLPKGLTPEDIFHYIYAVLYSPEYRRRYAEFLKMDFPRLPLTSSLDLFRALAKLGGELVALHLMESPKLDKYITNWHGATPSGEVEKVSYVEAASSRLSTRQDAASTGASTDGAVFIDKAQTQGFHGVPENVWNFHIGGYQVCHKWLKDRKGRTLSADDIVHYQKIVVALNETICLMAEIDKVIEAHGGWPDAFTPGAHVAARP